MWLLFFIISVVVFISHRQVLCIIGVYCVVSVERKRMLFLYSSFSLLLQSNNINNRIFETLEWCQMVYVKGKSTKDEDFIFIFSTHLSAFEKHLTKKTFGPLLLYQHLWLYLNKNLWIWNDLYLWIKLLLELMTFIPKKCIKISNNRMDTGTYHYFNSNRIA